MVNTLDPTVMTMEELHILLVLLVLLVVITLVFSGKIKGGYIYFVSEVGYKRAVVWLYVIVSGTFLAWYSLPETSGIPLESIVHNYTTVQQVYASRCVPSFYKYDAYEILLACYIGLAQCWYGVLIVNFFVHNERTFDDLRVVISTLELYLFGLTFGNFVTIFGNHYTSAFFVVMLFGIRNIQTGRSFEKKVFEKCILVCYSIWSVVYMIRIPELVHLRYEHHKDHLDPFCLEQVVPKFVGEAVSDYDVGIAIKKHVDSIDYVNMVLWTLYHLRAGKLTYKEISMSLVTMLGSKRSITFIENMKDFFDEKNLEPEACGNVFDNALGKLNQLKEAKTLATGSKFFFGVMALPALDLMGFSYSKSSMAKFVKQKAIKTSFDNPVDALESLLKFLSSLTEAGHKYFETREISSLFAMESDVNEFLTRYEEIEDELRKQYVNPAYRASDMYEKMKILEKDGRALLKKDFSHLVNNCLKSLATKLTLVARAASHCSFRKPPFAILYFSPPGQGKSNIIKQTVEYYHGVITEKMNRTLAYDPSENVFTQNPLDEFQSGYLGTVHWAYVMDDIAYETKDVIKTTGSVSLKTLIQVCNTVGYASNQAELEKKGVIPFNPRCVVATTNVKDLNAVFAVEEEVAILRRLPIVITPITKEEYREGGKLSLERVQDESGNVTYQEVNDPWYYIVERIQFDPDRFTPGKGTPWWYEKVFPEPVPAAVYWKWIAEQIEKDELMGDCILNSFKHNKLHGYCNKCETMKRFCSCLKGEAVSAFEWIGYFAVLYAIYRFFTETICIYSKQQVSIREAYRSKLPFHKRCFEWFEYNVWNSRFLESISSGITNILLLSGYTIAVKAGKGYTGSLLIWSDYLFPSATRKAFLILVEKLKPESVQAIKGFLKVTATLGGIVVVAKALYSLMPKVEPLRGEAAGGVWYNANEDTFICNDKVQKIAEAEDVIRTLRSSMVHLTISRDGIVRRVSGLNLGNGNILTVRHVFGHLDWWTIGMYYGARQNVSASQGSRIERSQVKFLPNDMAIISTGWSVPRKDISDFIQDPWKPNGRVKMVKALENGQLEVIDGSIYRYTNLSYNRGQETEIDPETGEIARYHVNDGMVAKYTRSVMPGDCGAVVLVEHRKGWMIHSMITSNCTLEFEPLTLDTPRFGVSAIINKQDLKVPAIYSYAASLDIPIRGNEKRGSMGEISERFKHQWAGPIHGELMGSYPNPPVSKSRVVDSPIAEKIYMKFPNMNRYGAPQMKKKKLEDGSYFDPYVVSIQQSGKPKFRMNESKLKKAADAYFGKLLKKDLSTLRPLSISEAINGVQGNDFLNPLVMSTSGGMFKPGAKSKNFEFIDGLWKMNEELEEAYQEGMNLYLSGNRAHYPFLGSLKDEPVKISKLKTRVFTAASLPFTIIERQQFLTVAEWFMRNNLDSECAAGMNCYGPAWNDLYDYLTFGGTVLDRFGDGDYSHYDKDMLAIAINLAYEGLTAMCKQSGNFSLQDYVVQRGIKTDVCYPIVDHNGDVMMHYVGHCSGHALTVIINSIVNSIYMRAVYSNITGNPAEKFDEEIRLMVLGDDNIWNSLNHLYHFNSIAAAMARLGLSYTPGDKSGESPDYKNVSQTTFVKRTFRYVNGKMVAPLDLESTLKSFTCYEDRGNVTYPEILAQSYLSALREWSLHGQNVFNMMKSKVEETVLSVPYVDLFLHPKTKWTWEQLFEWTTTGADLELPEEIFIGEAVSSREEFVFDSDDDDFEDVYVDYVSFDRLRNPEIQEPLPFAEIHESDFDFHYGESLDDLYSVFGDSVISAEGPHVADDLSEITHLDWMDEMYEEWWDDYDDNDDFSLFLVHSQLNWWNPSVENFARFNVENPLGSQYMEALPGRSFDSLRNITVARKILFFSLCESFGWSRALYRFWNPQAPTLPPFGANGVAYIVSDVNEVAEVVDPYPLAEEGNCCPEDTPEAPEYIPDAAVQH